MGKYYLKKKVVPGIAKQGRVGSDPTAQQGVAGDFHVAKTAQGLRLDVYVTEKLKSLTRSQVQRLIEEQQILVNRQVAKANYKLKTGDLLSYRLAEEKPLVLVPERLPLEIIYEDADILVVNKPQGMVVHPANGNYSGTLVNALLGYGCGLSGLNGAMRPGIVHRIDRDTSGLLVVAKNDEAHRSLAQQLKKRELKREYLALVHGVVAEPGGIIDAPIGRDLRNRQKMAVVFRNSKQAITRYWVLERLEKHTLLKCRLETGRTHQIRVHLAYLQHPVVGDPKYGLRKEKLGLTGQVLHSATLGFMHPHSKKWLEFSVAPPVSFQALLQTMGSEYLNNDTNVDMEPDVKIR